MAQLTNLRQQGRVNYLSHASQTRASGVTKSETNHDVMHVTVDEINSAPTQVQHS